MVGEFANSPVKELGGKKPQKLFKRHRGANHSAGADIPLMCLKVWGGSFLLGWNLFVVDETLRI